MFILYNKFFQIAIGNCKIFKNFLLQRLLSVFTIGVKCGIFQLEVFFVREKRERLQKFMSDFSYVLELFISCIIAVAVIILCVRLFGSMVNIAMFSGEEKILETILDRAMILAIGVEFIKMLCRHTPETVIEVLVFAIARQMVIIHKSAAETLVEVIAIAILFGVRKFLLTEKDKGLWGNLNRIKEKLKSGKDERSAQ